MYRTASIDEHRRAEEIILVFQAGWAEVIPAVDGREDAAVVEDVRADAFFREMRVHLPHIDDVLELLLDALHKGDEVQHKAVWLATYRTSQASSGTPVGWGGLHDPAAGFADVASRRGYCNA